ncbi:MAG TPA: AmmeMemoRadiSam system protein A [Accumulibacter sp.]|jgi:hypothetical protein|nr:AmmeMemoRadiSam system protein A [Accumulibacter sp.]HQC79832.1 AmmeMemoRadiSam system protein A [Accumulibacter sp.]
MRSTDGLGALLLIVARNAIGARFGVAERTTAHEPELAEPGATFVTLTQDGRLRGCIGSLDARRPLDRDVAENAVAAAFRDPRFPPLSAGEFPRTRVEVSLLTAAEDFPVADETDALARLRPGVDGVILRCGSRRATFLPQVWEQLPAPREFLAQLKRKAGLPTDFWSAQMCLARYEVKKWKEP